MAILSRTIGFYCFFNIDPGNFEFEKPSTLIKESEVMAQIAVIRSNGADGTVTLRWKTEDLTAVSGRDYEGGEGTITFEHGETKKMIEIPIIDDRVCILCYFVYIMKSQLF